MSSDCLHEMTSGQGWGCSGSSCPVNAQVNGESTDGRRQRLWVWKRLALAPSCGWPAWEEAGLGREESRSDGPAVQPEKEKQIWARKEETNLAGSGLCSTLQTPSFTRHCPPPRNCRDEWTEKTTAQKGPAQSPSQDRAELTPEACRLPPAMDGDLLNPNAAAASRASSGQGVGC